MTKKQLIKALEWYDDDMPVVLMGFYDVSHVQIILVPTALEGDTSVLSGHVPMINIEGTDAE